MVRAVVAADLMRLVAPVFGLLLFIPGCADISSGKKICAELTSARNVFLRAHSRSVDSVTRSLEYLSPPLFLPREGHRKETLELVARIMLGLLASAIAYFSIGVYSRFNASLFDWSWI